MIAPTRLLAAAVVLCAALARDTAGALSRSKLSIHTSMGPNSQKIISTGHPRLVKLLDSFGDAAWIKSQDPGIAIIGRIFLAGQGQSGDPAAAARAWWATVQSTIMQYPAVDYWEGYNEPAVGSASDMAWYAAMETQRVLLLANHSRRAAIGCFSVGVPDVTTPATVQAFYPAIDAAIQHGGILALHEYASPLLNATFTGDPQTGQGWLTGRYRKLYNQFLIPTSRTIPMAITENGIDGGTCGITKCPAHSSDGWKGFCDYWAGLGESDCNAFYLRQLQWYDQVLMSDKFVLGSTIFSLEISGWDAFDIAPIADPLATYLASSIDDSVVLPQP